MCAEQRLRLSSMLGKKQCRTLDQDLPPLVEWARMNRDKGKGGLFCVAPRLFLGNKQAANNEDLLLHKGIVGVCAVGAKQVFRGPGHHVSIEDNGSESMLPHFDMACAFVHQQRQRGGVLVHCKGGISRSPTLVIAYLMKHERLSLADAIEVCSLARPAARPRTIFMEDLATYAAILEEEHRWQRAMVMADEDQVIKLGPLDPGPKRQQIQADCSSLLEALQDVCITEACGEPPKPSPQLRKAPPLL